MAKFLLHIGLPKTATTAVQRFVFQNLPAEDFYYIGTRQPRRDNRSLLYSQIMQTIKSEGPEFNVLAGQLNQELQRLPANVSYLLSEEMFTVDSEIPWQSKIEHLAEIVRQFECRILVTIRKPRAAAFSLYSERWHKLQRDYPTFDDFLGSNQAKIYDYSTLIPMLEKCFGHPVQVLPFEYIGKNRMFLKGIEEFLGQPVGLKSLPKANTKPSSPDSVELEPLNLNAWLDELIRDSTSRPLKFMLKVLRRCLLPFRNRLETIDCPWTSRVIPKPNFENAKRHYTESRKWLLERYKIDYNQADDSVFTKVQPT